MTIPPRSPRAPRPTPPSDLKVLKRYDNIVKSSEDKREYRGLELSNNMKVLLISDPTTEKSAAALDVNVGYLSDPVDLPGLAHFCEHMLFLGTKKYPEENEYSKYLSSHGGTSNAATSSDHTMYYFDILPDHLGRALDIFAQFFIEPLFTETATGRELSAVNSEHEKNASSDMWRLDQLNKATSDPKHDYIKFGTGNKDTLETIPKKKGINVREELLKFHAKWYSSNIMTLCVFGKESLDELESMVVPLFSLVRNHSVTSPTWPTHPFSRDKLAKIAHIVPIKELRSLSIDFPIPDTRKHYKSGPSHYLSHLLGHEGPGSLLSLLKAKGWCNNLVGGSRIGARGFGFFGVQVDLTEDGINHVDDIVGLVFQYIALLKECGPQRWIWEEQKDLMLMEFRFKDTMEPRTCVTAHVHLMQDFPLEDVLSAYYILTDWRPELIMGMLSLLTPENVRIAVVAKHFEDTCTLAEPWYGTKYSLKDIPKDTIKKWKALKSNAAFHLPLPNEFIPTKFDIYNTYEPMLDHAPPIIIRDTHTVRAWFKPDTHYLLPKAMCTFDFVTPIAYADPINCNLTSIWVMLLRDSLQECAYAAELAGLRWSVGNAKNGIIVTIDGYDDKQMVLLEKIITRIVEFKTDPTRFEIMKENHIRGIKNFEAEQPYQHAVYQQALCLSDLVWTKGQLLEAANSVTPEMLDDYKYHFIRKVHVEGLLYGNVNKERALALAVTIEKMLPKDSTPLLAQQLLLSREVELEKGTAYLREVNNAVHKSSCATLYYACGVRNPRANVALELIAQILSEPCFNILRTQEQLGYIVFTGVRRSHGVQGLRVIVQGDKHPDYLENRIEAFLGAMESYISDMKEEDFVKHRSALAASRLEKPKRMSHRASQLWGEIVNQVYNFDRARLEVEQLHTITKQELYAYYMKHISASSDYRQKLSVHVISVAEGGAGLSDDGAEDKDGKEDRPEPDKNLVAITDLVDFKSRRKLYPHPIPHSNIPRKGAQSKL